MNHVLFVPDLHVYETRGGCSAYTYFVVDYCAIATPCVRSIGCVFALLMMIENALGQWAAVIHKLVSLIKVDDVRGEHWIVRTDKIK